MNGIVVIPAYNPEEVLIELAQQLWDYGNQIIIVDDGSTFERRKIFEKCRDVAVVIHQEENLGKGAAIKTALEYIQREDWAHEWIGIMDADGQHRPEDMERLLAHAARRKMTLVLGVREVGKKMPLKSRLGNSITRNVIRIITGKYISDTQTGLRAFDRNLIPQMLCVKGKRYEYETNVLLALIKAGISLEEVPIQTIYQDSSNSGSHFRPVKDSFRIYKDILKFALSSFSSFVLDYFLFLLFEVLFSGISAGTFVANVLARCISACYNYNMNTKFVFHEKKSLKSAMAYALLAMGILAGNNAILYVYCSLRFPVYAAKLLTELTLFLISFAVQKGIIYRKRPKLTESMVRENAKVASCTAHERI